MQEWQELGCYTTPGGHTRCTCATDFCNAPFERDTGDPGTKGTSSSATAAVSVASILPLAVVLKNVLLRGKFFSSSSLQ